MSGELLKKVKRWMRSWYFFFSIWREREEEKKIDAIESG